MKFVEEFLLCNKTVLLINRICYYVVVTMALAANVQTATELCSNTFFFTLHFSLGFKYSVISKEL